MYDLIHKFKIWRRKMKIDKLAELLVAEYSNASPGSETARAQKDAEIREMLKTMSQNMETHKFYVRVEVEL
jgi:hypothetical protein